MSAPLTEKTSGEPEGTVLLGSIDKRCYLFLCQTAKRMEIERANARQHGIQDPIDFIFELEGTRYEVSYARLCAALRAEFAPDPIGEALNSGDGSYRP